MSIYIFTSLSSQGTRAMTDKVLTVSEVSPPLPALQTLLDGLNASRDLFAFLRRIREAFVASLETT